MKSPKVNQYQQMGAVHLASVFCDLWNRNLWNRNLINH